MYSLPSTSRKREPCPSCTNSGYGDQPAQVARAVLFTPPGITRQAVSNNSALRLVFRPATSVASFSVAVMTRLPRGGIQGLIAAAPSAPRRRSIQAVALLLAATG